MGQRPVKTSRKKKRKRISLGNLGELEESSETSNAGFTTNQDQEVNDYHTPPGSTVSEMEQELPSAEVSNYDTGIETDETDYQSGNDSDFESSLSYSSDPEINEYWDHLQERMLERNKRNNIKMLREKLRAQGRAQRGKKKSNRQRQRWKGTKQLKGIRVRAPRKAAFQKTNQMSQTKVKVNDTPVQVSHAESIASEPKDKRERISFCSRLPIARHATHPTGIRKIHSKYTQTTSELLPDIEDQKSKLPTAELNSTMIKYTSTKSYNENPTGKFSTNSDNPFDQINPDNFQVIRKKLFSRGKHTVFLDSHRETSSLYLTSQRGKEQPSNSLNLDFRKRKAHPDQINLRCLEFIKNEGLRGYQIGKIKGVEVCLVVGNLYTQYKDAKFNQLIPKLKYHTRFTQGPSEKEQTKKFKLNYYNDRILNTKPKEHEKMNEGIYIYSKEPINWTIYIPHLLLLTGNSSMVNHILSDIADYIGNFRRDLKKIGATAQSLPPKRNSRFKRKSPTSLERTGEMTSSSDPIRAKLTESDDQRRSSRFCEHYKLQTIVMRDLRGFHDVSGIESLDTAGVSLLRDPGPYVEEYRTVSSSNGLAALVNYSTDIECQTKGQFADIHQTQWSDQEARITERFASVKTIRKIDKTGTVKVIKEKKIKKWPKTARPKQLYVPKIHVENAVFEPIAELYYGTSQNELYPIRALLDTGARCERILTACSLMSKWYFDIVCKQAPGVLRHIATSEEQNQVTLIDGTERIQAECQYYEFGLKAIGKNGKVVTDKINIAVVDKCIDAYELVLGVDQFRRIKPEFPTPDDPGNWIKFHGGPWKGMTVNSQTNRYQEKTTDGAAVNPQTKEAREKAVADYEYQAPITVNMPSMTCVDVRIDQYLIEQLPNLRDDQVYMVRLNPRALVSDLTAYDVTVTAQEIRNIQSGLAKEYIIRINNMSKGKRTLHLDDLFRVESLGSHKLVCTLPGYKYTQGPPQDVFDDADSNLKKDLTEEEITEMLNEVATEFADALEQKERNPLGIPEAGLSGCRTSREGPKVKEPDKDLTEKLAGIIGYQKMAINEKPERSYTPIHMIGSLSSAKPIRGGVQTVIEKSTGQTCYLIEPGKDHLTITSKKWKEKDKDLNYLTIFKDYDTKTPMGTENREFKGSFKIIPNEVVFLSPHRVNWNGEITFLQRTKPTNDESPNTSETIPVNAKVERKTTEVAGMSKNSYKHEKKKTDDANIEEDLLKEIKEKKEKVMQQETIDRSSKSWKEKVWKLMSDRFSDKLKKELTKPEKQNLRQAFEKEFTTEAARYHEEGCPTPEYILEKAGVLKKENATWKVLPYFNLSYLDQIRLSWIVSEEVRKGNLVKWEPGMDLPLHASPAFIAARKGHLTGRMVVDFRNYNQQVLIPCFSMPNSENILADLTEGDAEYFGASDLATGYFHAQLDDSEIPYLAITTQDGIYFSKKLQLGPSWAPAWFQSRSRSAFPPEFHVYIDDILFKAKSAEDLLAKIKIIHQCCKRTGFVLSLKKTYWGVTEVDALGHTVTTQGRCAAAGKLELIKNWEFPKTVQNLKSFVCVLVYLRDYIWKFAEKVYPLKKYLRGKEPTPISELATDTNAQRAIQLLKNSIATKATIKHIDRKAASNYKETGRPVLVYVDASQYAKCFVICQRPERRKAPQIAVYKARTFSETERKWSTLERELNAMLYFVEEGIRYIEGVPTVLLFDHKNLGEAELQSIWCNKQKSDKISRWCDRIIGSLQKLQIKRHYLPGQLNLLADVGSRYGYDTNRDQEEIPENIKDLVKTLFNTTDTDAKSIEELIQNAEKEQESSKFQQVAAEINQLQTTAEKLAAITIFSRIASASKAKETATDEKDYEPEDPKVFDNEKINKATKSAFEQAHYELDVSAWKDPQHYKEEEYYYEDQISALKADEETHLKFSIFQVPTARGYNYRGQIHINAANLGLKDKEGQPTKDYDHWETYEKRPKKPKWKPTTPPKQKEERRKEIEKHSLSDPKWTVVIRKKDKTETKGYKEYLTVKKDATKELIARARTEAKEHCVQHIREKILEFCPEPKKGQWWILEIGNELNKTIERWRHNFALGPIEKLNPEGNWILTEDKRKDNGHHYKIYTRKEENPTVKNLVIGGSKKDGNKQVDDNEKLLGEDNDIFQGLEAEAIDSDSEVPSEKPKNKKPKKTNKKLSKKVDKKSDKKLESQKIDTPKEDVESQQKEDAEVRLEKFLKSRLTREQSKDPLCDDCGLPFSNDEGYCCHCGVPDEKEQGDTEKEIEEIPTEDEDEELTTTNMEIRNTEYEPDQSKKNSDLMQKEIEIRKTCKELYKKLEKIIAENHENYPVWSRNEGDPRWKTQSKDVFKLIDHVFEAEQYDKVEILNNKTETILLKPRRTYKIILLTTENDEPRIFPAMSTIHFGPNQHQIKITDFLENVNAQPNTPGHKLTGALVYSRELKQAEQGNLFDDDELKRLKTAQEKCKELQWKIGYLQRGPEKGEEWLGKKLTKAQFRVELFDLKQNKFEMINELLHMNRRVVIPRCEAKDIFPKPTDQHNATNTKHLRTYFIHRAHRYHHDNQTTRQRITDEWGITWPRIEKDIHHYEQNCLFCLIEKPIPKFTTSYVSEIYGERNHVWFIDHQGPFGIKKRKFYLLTVIDDATGRVWIRRTKTKDAKSVAEYLKELFSHCDPHRIPARISIYGNEDEVAPSVPEKIRADNGFGIEITKFCRKYAKKYRMAYTPAFVPGTAENPEGQHRIERPHRSFRKWINAANLERNEELMDDPDIADILANTWNHRKAYQKYKPYDCYYGLPIPFEKIDLQTANEYRNQTRRQLVADLTALRQAKSEESHRRHMKKHGLIEENYQQGELAILAHLSAKRKSKQSFLSNYRCQIFRIGRNKDERTSLKNRAYLIAAVGDRPIQFKQPVNIKKLRKIPAHYGKYLDFNNEPDSAATEDYVELKDYEDLVDTTAGEESSSSSSSSSDSDEEEQENLLKE